jgi:hypothetical protein
MQAADGDEDVGQEIAGSANSLANLLRSLVGRGATTTGPM